jgi:putative phosphoribosyl transferase
LAMGAVASGGVIVRNNQVLGALKMSEEGFASATAAALSELKERELALRGSEQELDIAGKTAIVVDDGMATGSTMQAAVEALRTLGPRSIVVAVPVAAPEVVTRMERVADEVVSLLTPRSLIAVGAWYRQFGQTPESEVRRLLDEANAERDL